MSKPRLITIDGINHPVVKNLGFQGGPSAKRVRRPDGSEAVAVKEGPGPWRLWTAADRVGRGAR
jgi:hypothetical protein